MQSTLTNKQRSVRQFREEVKRLRSYETGVKQPTGDCDNDWYRLDDRMRWVYLGLYANAKQQERVGRNGRANFRYKYPNSGPVSP